MAYFFRRAYKHQRHERPGAYGQDKNHHLVVIKSSTAQHRSTTTSKTCSAASRQYDGADSILLGKAINGEEAF